MGWLSITLIRWQPSTSPPDLMMAANDALFLVLGVFHSLSEGTLEGGTHNTKKRPTYHYHVPPGGRLCQSSKGYSALFISHPHMAVLT